LDSDSISIRTCFLNLLLEFTRTTYPGNLYPIGLPNRLTQITPKQLTRTSPNRLTRAIPDRINAYLALYVHTRPNYLTRFFFRSDFYLPGLTQSYPAELPYPIFSRSEFCLPDHTWSPYLTSLPGQVTHRCTRLLTRPYPITLPGRVTFNCPHTKTFSSSFHLDLGLFWPLMHQDRPGNPEATRITPFASPETESTLPILTPASPDL
jgi:hypothetical protein